MESTFCIFIMYSKLVNFMNDEQNNKIKKKLIINYLLLKLADHLHSMKLLKASKEMNSNCSNDVENDINEIINFLSL